MLILSTLPVIISNPTPILALLLSLSCFVTLLSLDAVTLRSSAAFNVTFSPSTLLPLILISSSVEVIVTSPSALILLPRFTMVVLSLLLSDFSVPKLTFKLRFLAGSLTAFSSVDQLFFFFVTSVSVSYAFYAWSAATRSSSTCPARSICPIASSAISIACPPTDTVIPVLLYSCSLWAL